MHLRTLAALLCLPLLGACSGKLLPETLMPDVLRPAPAADTPPERITWERTALCKRSDCTLVNVDTLRYAGEPALNELIDQALLRMADAPPLANGPDPLQRYTDVLFQRQPAGKEVWLQAKQLDQHDDLLVIELSSYIKDREQGWPGRNFINYSRSHKRSLQPSELFLPEQEFEFWNAVREAHLAWLRQQNLLDNRTFRTQWPFRRTQNIALLRDRVRIKYEVASIGPYQMGHPYLDIPYARLQNVLKPQYIPASQMGSPLTGEGQDRQKKE